MSVPVARADADQHRARGHRLQELGRAVPGTVVGHLEDVGAQRHIGGEQLRLRGHLDVAAEQERADGRRGPQDDRAVVHGRAVVRVDGVGSVPRAEHLERERGPAESDPRGDLHHPRPGRLGLPAHALQRPHGLADRPDGDGTHGPPA